MLRDAQADKVQWRAEADMEQATTKKGLPTWAIVLIVLAAGGVVGIPIVSALAIYGVRKYIMSAKSAEAPAMLQEWSRGLVSCGEKQGALPPSTVAVPASLASVSGKKYQSAANEWADVGFSCAGFAPSTPQFFQYQWVQRSEFQGALRAVGDLDGDGSPEVSFEATVTCASGRCSASSPTSTASP